MVLLNSGNEIDRVVGANPAACAEKISKLVAENLSVEKRLQALINQKPIMAFIKGTPDQPRCGFTRTLVTLFKELNIEYGSFDILSDEEVRQSLKVYSNWPTYPQVYANGVLVGGLDIIKELHAVGELLSTLKG